MVVNDSRENNIFYLVHVESLKDVGKLEELQHEMKRYDWNILGLCQSRLLRAREKSTQEGHRLFWVAKTTYMSKVLGSLCTRTP